MKRIMMTAHRMTDRGIAFAVVITKVAVRSHFAFWVQANG